MWGMSATTAAATSATATSALAALSGRRSRCDIGGGGDIGNGDGMDGSAALDMAHVCCVGRWHDGGGGGKCDRRTGAWLDRCIAQLASEIARAQGHGAGSKPTLISG